MSTPQERLKLFQKEEEESKARERRRIFEEEERSNNLSVPTIPTTPEPSAGYLSDLDKKIRKMAGGVGSAVADVYRKTPGTQYISSAIQGLGPVLDFISRPRYGVNKFFDSLPDDAFALFSSTFGQQLLLQHPIDLALPMYKKTIEAIPEAARLGVNEMMNPKERISGSDLVKKTDPQFAKDFPTSTAMIGFMSDVIYDPISYLGVSTTARGIQVGGRVLSTEGKQVLARQIARETTKVTLGTKTTTQTGKEIIKELKTLGTQDVKGLVPRIKSAAEELSVGKEGIRESAENQVLKLIDLDPKLAERLLEKRGVRSTILGVEVPFISQASVEVQNAMGLVSAYDQMKALQRLPGVKKVSEMFNRNAGLKQEYVELRDSLQNHLDYVTDETLKTTEKIFSISKKQREELKVNINEFKSKLRDEEKKLGRGLTPDEANHFIDDATRKIALDPDQMAIFSRSMSMYKHLQEVENKGNLL